MIMTIAYIFNSIEVGSRKDTNLHHIWQICNNKNCLCWLSDCENLVGSITGEMMGLVLVKKQFKRAKIMYSRTTTGEAQNIFLAYKKRP